MRGNISKGAGSPLLPRFVGPNDFLGDSSSAASVQSASFSRLNFSDGRKMENK
jgi:hypothetical protein